MKWLRDWFWYDIYGPKAGWYWLLSMARGPQRRKFGWKVKYGVGILGDKNRLVKVQ